MDLGRDEAVGLFRQTPLFAGLPEVAVAQLAAGATLRRVRAGEWLFRQGDAGEHIYVVVSGRLEAIVESPRPDQVVRVHGRGELIGELAFITGWARSASVRARRDAELLEIPYTGFRDLVRRHTDVAVEILHVLARRLATGTVTPAGSVPRTVAVVDLREREAVPVIGSLADAFGDRVATVSRADRRPAAEPGRLVDELERTHDTVVLATAVADPADWLNFCRRQADRVLCVADVTDRPQPAGLALLAGCDLALTGQPSGRTASWLDALRPRAHHWLDLPNREAGVARLVRRLLGRSTGVVFSGGGARCFAHIGVLERLRERGITVDRIGGCSMGAFVAALVAMGLSAREMVDICREEFVRRNPFNDYTLPRVSVIRARKAAALMDRVFGATGIENCALDYFCVSSDLVSADLVVHRRGQLARAVEASMSIPGFAPPVEADGRLLVDGGVLDNLPVGRDDGSWRRSRSGGRRHGTDPARPAGHTADTRGDAGSGNRPRELATPSRNRRAGPARHHARRPGDRPARLPPARRSRRGRSPGRRDRGGSGAALELEIPRTCSPCRARQTHTSIISPRRSARVTSVSRWSTVPPKTLV